MQATVKRVQKPDVMFNNTPLIPSQKEVDGLKSEMLNLKQQQEEMAPPPPTKVKMVVPSDDVINKLRTTRH